MVGQVIDLDKKYGRFSARVWGLIANLIGNTITLFGVAKVIRGEGGLPILIIGLIITCVCIAVIAIPDKSEDI